MSGWDDAPYPDHPPFTWGDRLRIAARILPLALLVFGGLLLLLTVRLVERPLAGPSRPVSPRITQGVCRGAVWLCGLDWRSEGRMMDRPGALVANHASWLDIFVLNAAGPLYFVSKSEVADWPGIGWLARATGTVFIRRDRREAAAQRDTFVGRLRDGHRLLFFPEGTSTDGRRVLPFKTTLFAAFFTDDMKARMAIQPVSVRYTAPEGQPPEFYGWWGDMEFGPHLLRVLSARHRGAVRVEFHAPLSVADFPDRKALARAAELSVCGDRPSE